MNWLPFALLTILLYTLHDVLLKHFAGNTNSVLATMLINLSAAFSIFIYLLGNYFFTKNTPIKMNQNQTVWLIVAGIALGIATITFMKSFNKVGGDFSVVLPFVYVGIIIISVFIGKLFFNEKISMKQVIGICISSVGLFLIAKK